MKKLLPLLSLIFLFAACGENGSSESSDSENILENLTYSIDTVVVNPGEDIINLSRGISRSDLSKDKKTLYLWDDVGGKIAVIDLDAMKLAKQLPMEKEGPNGIGQYLSIMELLPDGNFVMAGFNSAGIFTPSGEKVKDLKFTAKDIEGIDLDDEMALTNSLLLSQDQSYLFALPNGFGQTSLDLVVLKPDSKTGKLVKIPSLDQAASYNIMLRSKDAMSVYAEQKYLQEIEGKLYISTSATSDVYRYDFQQDSLHRFAFPHQLVPAEKTGTVINEVSSEQEFNAEMSKLSDQIGFEKLIWDGQRRMFFKFARRYYPTEDKVGPYPADVYLLAYDAELNLVGEKELDELDKVPSSPFFKDGKLWSYVNVEDELGFAVFTFDF